MGRDAANNKFGLQTPRKALRRTIKPRRGIRFEKDDWYANATSSIAITSRGRGARISSQWITISRTGIVDDHN